MRAEKIETSHPGIEYIHYTNDTPLSIHVLKADPKQCKAECAKALNSGIGRECLPTIAARYHALGGINGGYFTVGGPYDGRSSGICKVMDRWFAAPVHETSAIAWNAGDNRVECCRAGVLWFLKINEIQLPVDHFNSSLKPEMATLYSWGMHRSTLTTVGALEVVFKDGFVTEVRKPGGDTEIPRGGWVYAIDKKHSNYNIPFEVGMKVELDHKFIFFNENFEDLQVTSEYREFWHNADYILSGGPILIKDGIVTNNFDNDILKQSILYSRQPRSIIGVTENDEWVLVAIEGRQPKVSIGMDVIEAAAFLKSHGCKHALNLDGGASVLLTVEGKMVNTPLFNGIESEYEFGQRRVADALLILPR